MNKWQKISIVLAGLLVLSCIALAGLGVWTVTSGPGAAALAGLTGRTPTPTAAPNPAGAALPSAAARGVLAGLFGTVSNVNGSTLSVVNAQGKTQSITIGSNTRLIVTGVANPTAADIKPGDKLLVIGPRQGADSLTPRAVIVAPASYTRDNIKAGKIQSVSAQMLTVVTGTNATVTVGTDANTQILGPTLQPIAAAQAVNANALIIGQPGSNGQFLAQLILARQP